MRQHQKQKWAQQQQKQHQQQQYPPAGNDDMLPSAPPAFPQPVSSLPSNPMQQYMPPAEALAAAAAARMPGQPHCDYPIGLPISSRAYSAHMVSPHHRQQHQGLPWTSAAATVPYSNGIGGYHPIPAATVNATGAAPYGYAGDAVPYDAVMAQYAVFGGGGPYGDSSVPLLTGADGLITDMVFANRQVRHAFLRKVLGLITVQLLLTVLIAAPVYTHKTVRQFLSLNPWVFWLSLIITFTLLLVLALSEAARRRYPLNLLLLLVFTVANGLLVGVASATYFKQTLLLGLLIAASVSLSLIVYASQTSVEFSAPGGILYSASMILLSVTLADWFLGFKTLHLLIGGCGALLFSAYLVYDVQLLASGESCYQVLPDEYVFATINVYTDVITLFMYILQVMTQLHGHDDE